MCVCVQVQTKEGLLECFSDCRHRVTFEQQALVVCNHPFIIGLDYSFQTDVYAIMVMELGTGTVLSPYFLIRIRSVVVCLCCVYFPVNDYIL